MNRKPHRSRKKLSIDQAYMLGRQHQREGRTDNARAIFRKILKSRPDHHEALFALGIIAFRDNRLDAAEKLFRRASRLKPNEPNYALNLGVVMDRRGDQEAAEACYRQAIESAPDHVGAHYSLGVTLQKQMRLVEAEQVYRHALELDPRHTNAHANLVWALCQLERMDEAEELLQPLLARAGGDPAVLLCHGQLLRKRNDFVAAELPLRHSLAQQETLSGLTALASVLRQNNRPAEAAPLARRAFELASSSLSALWELVQSHAFDVGDPLLDLLENRARGASPGSADSMALQFMLAKAYDDLDLYQRAAACARRGNDALFARQPFALDRQLEATERIITTCREPRVAPQQEGDGPIPIFIVGESRAGKTLVESLLTSQMGVYAGGESKDLNEAITAHLDREQEASGPVSRWIELEADQDRAFGEAYLQRLRARAPSARWVTSTLPGYYRLLSLIFPTLPGARVIHCHRDPLDQCVEMYLRYYSNSGMSYTSDPGTLAAFHRDYRRLMAHWNSVYGDRILNIRYESLVGDPQRAAERVYDYCGLQGGKAAYPVAFDTTRIGRGKRYAPFLPELTEGLGLDPAGGQRGRPDEDHVS